MFPTRSIFSLATPSLIKLSFASGDGVYKQVADWQPLEETAVSGCSSAVLVLAATTKIIKKASNTAEFLRMGSSRIEFLPVL